MIPKIEKIFAVYFKLFKYLNDLTRHRMRYNALFSRPSELVRIVILFRITYIFMKLQSLRLSVRPFCTETYETLKRRI